MSFIYLLAGHILGDFILQTGKIAENKNKSWKWLLFHSLIVTMCIWVFALPFGKLAILLIFVNGVLHFLIDYYKPIILKKFNLPGILYFLIDQFIHFLILYFISLNINKIPSKLFFDQDTIVVLLVLSFVSFFFAIFNQFAIIHFFPREKEKFFEIYEKSIGMITRVLIFFILIISYIHSYLYIAFLPFIVVIPIIPYKTKWQKWMGMSEFITKLSFDIIISIIAFVLLIKK